MVNVKFSPAEKKTVFGSLNPGDRFKYPTSNWSITERFIKIKIDYGYIQRFYGFVFRESLDDMDENRIVRFKDNDIVVCEEKNLTYDKLNTGYFFQLYRSEDKSIYIKTHGNTCINISNDDKKFITMNDDTQVIIMKIDE